MKRISHKIINRRVFASVLCFALIASLLASGLAFLAPIPSTTAQTNPQTTDIFTGQFIPTYFGAAYDPSEAYKQMAGMEVLVFGYDTWGTIVNNFAYRTQIKANGSFQAAGLPNASHYGICLNAPDSNTALPFRAPRKEDGIEGAFAYSQATFSKQTTANTQTGQAASFYPFHNQADPNQSCRIFTTSSRSVDIANHINIFPIVPNQVLSVLTLDNNAITSGQYNYSSSDIDTPYEVYAQRVVTTNAQRTPTASDGTGSSTDPTYSTGELKVAAYGPIIRGRTISRGAKSLNPDGTINSQGTIFQAYAPPGIYAITLWRPNPSLVDDPVTYLTYNGSESLSTPYNGIAFETVADSSKDSSNQYYWQSLRERLVKETAEKTSQAWVMTPNSQTLWGLIKDTSTYNLYLNRSGEVLATGGTLNLAISGNSNPLYGASAIPTETSDYCLSNMVNKSLVSSGIYLFTNQCRDSSIATPITQGTTVSVNLADQASRNRYQMPNTTAYLSGTAGPTRKDIALGSFGDEVVGSARWSTNNPIAMATVNLTANGHKIRNVAITDAQGQYRIPAQYFAGNTSESTYQLEVIPYDRTEKQASKHTNTASLSGSDVELALNSNSQISAITLNKNQDYINTLASLSIEGLHSLFKVNPFVAYAQPVNTDNSSTDDVAVVALAKSCENVDGQLCATIPNGGRVAFNLDLKHLDTNTKENFKYANYDLKILRITNLEGGQRLANNDSVNIGETELNNQVIEGNVLDESKTIDKVVFNFEDSDGDRANPTLNDIFGNDTDIAIKTKLTVTFTKKDIGDIDSENPTTVTTTDESGIPEEVDSSVAGDTLPGAADILSKTIDVVIVNCSGDNSYPDCVGGKYLIRASTIALEASDPGCQISWRKPSTWFTGWICKAVVGGTQVLDGAFSFIVDNFLYVQPLQNSAVIKLWNIVRNLVNAFAFIVLVFAGIAIMLRLDPKTYNINSILTKFVVAIVLANFSTIILQFAVDIANMFSAGMYYLLTSIVSVSGGSGISPAAMAGAVTAAVTSAIIGIVSSAVVTGGFGLIGLLFIGLSLVIMAAFYLFKVMAQFYIRIAILWLAVIIAPLAFFANILPSTRSYYTKWKNIFTGTLFAQVGAALMMAVALAFLTLLPDVNTTNSVMSNFFSGLTYMFICIAMFYLIGKAPAATASMLGAGVTANLMNKAAGITKTWGDKTLKGFGNQQAYRLRRAQSSAEDQYREQMELEPVKGLGKASRFVRQATGLGNKQIEEAEALQKASQTGFHYAENVHEIEGDPVRQKEVAEKLMPSLKTTIAAANPLWTPTQVEDEARIQANRQASKAMRAGSSSVLSNVPGIRGLYGSDDVRRARRDVEDTHRAELEASHTNTIQELIDKKKESDTRKATALEARQLASQIPGFTEAQRVEAENKILKANFNTAADHLLDVTTGDDIIPLQTAQKMGDPAHAPNPLAAPINTTVASLEGGMFAKIQDPTARTRAATTMHTILGTNTIATFGQMSSAAGNLAGNRARVESILRDLGYPQRLIDSVPSSTARANLMLKALVMNHATVATKTQFSQLQKKYNSTGDIA